MRRLGQFWFGETDLAPLAAFRVLFGGLLFNWFWQLLPNLTPFFTDIGMLPRTWLLERHGERFTLLAAGGDWWYVFAVWLVCLAASLLLLVGLFTRAACVACFLGVTAFEARNPLMLDGSDFVYRVVPFWLAFTAAGNRYALDALRRRARGDPPSPRGWAFPVRLLELQVAWIYLATGLEKLAGRQWLEGTAVYYALQLKHTFGRWYAEPLAHNPLLVRIATWGTLGLELGFLPLAFSPVLHRHARLLAVVGAAGLHVGIVTMMNVGNFPVTMLVALVLFLPPGLVEDAAERLAGVARRIIPTVLLARAATLAAGAPPVPSVPRGRRARRWVRRSGALGLALLALAAFATALPAAWSAYRPSGPLGRLLAFVSLDQRWDMFSPDPASSDGWLLAPATLADGTQTDLLTGGPPSTAPRYADPFYSRWAKVVERIANVAYADYRLEIGRMYCRLHNLQARPGQARLVSFELYYVERVIPPPGAAAPPPRQHHLWSHTC